MVGGAAMFKSKDIVDNAVNSADHTTLVADGKCGARRNVERQRPFTVFAPVYSAFDKLPAGTVETLLKPENKGDADQHSDISRVVRKVRFKCNREEDQGGKRESVAQIGQRRNADRMDGWECNCFE